MNTEAATSEHPELGAMRGHVAGRCGHPVARFKWAVGIRNCDGCMSGVLLSGVVGSTAYGLALPGSDVDRMGIYAAPTIAFHGLNPPTGREGSIVSVKPDTLYHEAGKFARLCLQCNPSVTELLWLETYEDCTTLGVDLIAIRRAFLSAHRVRASYLGYASQQFDRLAKRGDGSFSADTRKRTGKHARHLMRLCQQGLELYQTGQLTIRLAEPEQFHAFGERVAAGDIEAARRLVDEYGERFDRVSTILPGQPDRDEVERWLHRVRAVHYDYEPVEAG